MLRKRVDSLWFQNLHRTSGQPSSSSSSHALFGLRTAGRQSSPSCEDLKRKMFLLRLFLWAMLISLVRGNALTTQAGAELQKTNETTDENLQGDPESSRRPISTSPFQQEDQTPIVTQLPDQERIPDQNTTEETASPFATVTTGNTETSSPEASSITSEDKGLTTEQRTQSTASAARDHAIYREDDKKRFEYDYKTLRIQGLICALILFILGILILTCGRCRIVSCCRKRKPRRALDEMTRL